MPAPLVIPMVENLGSATGYAEKINQVSENKCKIEVGLIDFKQNIVLSRMDKEMRAMKQELTKMKQPGKRCGVKEPGRASPKAKVTKAVDTCESPRSEDGENVDPKRRSKSGQSKTTRDAEERITNLHRRYSAQLRSGPLLKGKQIDTKLNTR